MHAPTPHKQTIGVSMVPAWQLRQIAKACLQKWTAEHCPIHQFAGSVLDPELTLSRQASDAVQQSPDYLHHGQTNTTAVFSAAGVHSIQHFVRSAQPAHPQSGAL